MGKIQAARYHDISVGHRVHGHESKCANLHGHNYRIFFTVEAETLDSVGRVLDFSVIKKRLCEWLEEHWDHKFLAWEKDPFMLKISSAGSYMSGDPALDERLDTMLGQSIVFVPFNPTAENMAQYLVTVIGPDMLAGLGVKLVEVRVEETRKCSANYMIDKE